MVANRKVSSLWYMDEVTQKLFYYYTKLLDEFKHGLLKNFPESLQNRDRSQQKGF